MRRTKLLAIETIAHPFLYLDAFESFDAVKYAAAIPRLRQFGDVFAVGDVDGAAGLVVVGLAVVDAQVVQDH